MQDEGPQNIARDLVGENQLEIIGLQEPSAWQSPGSHGRRIARNAPGIVHVLLFRAMTHHVTPHMAWTSDRFEDEQRQEYETQVGIARASSTLHRDNIFTDEKAGPYGSALYLTPLRIGPRAVSRLRNVTTAIQQEDH